MCPNSFVENECLEISMNKPFVRKVIRFESEEEYERYIRHKNKKQVKQTDKINSGYWENREAKIEYQKKYNVERRDMKSYNKSYYEENKYEIIQRMCERMTCSCGKIVSKGNLSSHQKTNIHKKNLQTL
jgi:hypothetical protein